MKDNKYRWLLLLAVLASCYKQPSDSATTCDAIYGTDRLEGQIYTLYNNVSQTPVFPNSKLIKIDPFVYARNGRTFLINPQRNLSFVLDPCTFVDSVDVHDKAPTFILPVLNAKLYAICISSEVLTIARGNAHSIDNVEDIVWTWNNNMNTGQISNGRLVLQLNDGQPVLKGQADITRKLASLPAGQVYFLSMWAWNDDGTDVVQSSSCIPFLVNNRDVSFDNYYFLKGKWALKRAINKNSGADQTNSIQPQALNFLLFPCIEVNGKFVTAPEIAYIEDTLSIYPRVSDAGDTVFLDKSKYFKKPILMQSLCDTKMIFDTQFGDSLFTLTYTR